MVNRILAVRNDRFGEFLLNIPAFRGLKENYPRAKLTLVVNSYVKELAESIDFVDEIITWENKKHKLKEILKFSRELKSKKFDLCIVFNPSKEFNIISFLAGIPIRVGYKRKWGFLLTKKIEDKKYLGQKHEIDYNLDLIRLLGIKTVDKSLSLKIDNNLAADIFRKLNLYNLDNLIALHPWTSDPVKQWPESYFCQLAQRLDKEMGLKVLVIGGKEELDKSNNLFDGLGSNIINLTGKTTLLELAALLKNCRLLVSGDSGPVHLASCVGTPVLAIFRNDLLGKGPVRWGPRSLGSIVIDKPDLSKVTVEEVFIKAKEILDR